MKYALVYSHCWLRGDKARTAKVMSVHKTEDAARGAKTRYDIKNGYSTSRTNILAVDNKVKKGDTIEERYIVKET